LEHTEEHYLERGDGNYIRGRSAAIQCDQAFDLRCSFAAGISWGVAHNLISGISYFAVWMLIWRGNLADMANVSD
jgi:hypothetical protein